MKRRSQKEMGGEKIQRQEARREGGKFRYTLTGDIHIDDRTTREMNTIF